MSAEKPVYGGFQAKREENGGALSVSRYCILIAVITRILLTGKSEKLTSGLSCVHKVCTFSADKNLALCTKQQYR
tara:strand:- start:16 stop:240 length:225 start_codon:yes stop_codon:yes gene_type:complete